MTTTVGDIITQAKQLANRPDGAFDARALNAVNRAQQYWAERLPWRGLVRDEDFVASGEQFIILPPRVAFPISIGDTTRNRHIEPGESLEVNYDLDWFAETAGDALEWRDEGFQPVIAQPSTEAVLNLTASVSESFNVLVRGLVRDAGASGTALEKYIVEENVPIGSDAVTTTDNSYLEVLAVEKSFNTTARLDVNDSVSGDIMARLMPWEERARYRKISTVFKLNAGDPIRVRYYTQPQQITATTQPVEQAIDKDYLVWRVAGDLHWINNEAQAADRAWAKAEELLQNRIHAIRAFGRRGGAMIPSEKGICFGDMDLNDQW